MYTYMYSMTVHLCDAIQYCKIIWQRVVVLNHQSISAGKSWKLIVSQLISNIILIVWFSTTTGHLSLKFLVILRCILRSNHSTVLQFSKVFSSSQTTHQNTASKVLSSQDKSLFLLLVAAEDACQVVPTQIIPNLAIYMMMNGLLQRSQVCKKSNSQLKWITLILPNSRNFLCSKKVSVQPFLHFSNHRI